MSRAVLAWAPALAWAAALWMASSLPTVPGPELPAADKVAHFSAYAVLGALLAFGAARTGTAPGVAVALGLLYGGVDEVHQAFVPGRAPDPLDWVADAAGVLAAVFLYTRWRDRRAARRAGPADDAPSLCA